MPRTEVMSVADPLPGAAVAAGWPPALVARQPEASKNAGSQGGLATPRHALCFFDGHQKQDTSKAPPQTDETGLGSQAQFFRAGLQSREAEADVLVEVQA